MEILTVKISEKFSRLFGVLCLNIISSVYYFRMSVPDPVIAYSMAGLFVLLLAELGLVIYREVNGKPETPNSSE